MCVVWAGLGFLLASCPIAAADFSWQKPHATVEPTGDLKWAPQPFAYAPGKSVIYIDYEKGDDNNSGTVTTSPFKHHPWDPEAKGAAAATAGIKTYVFKRGVIYRGTLTAKESGREGDPIRLTSDPAWGAGEACLFGSERITGGWKRCTAAEAVKNLTPDNVWYIDLDITPELYLYDCDHGVTAGKTTWVQTVCEFADTLVKRINLARAPNWTVTVPDHPLSNWWVKKTASELFPLEGNFPQTAASDWVGGSAWMDYNGNMGNVTQGCIKEYRAGSIAIDLTQSNGSHYFLENLPQLLDEPNEYYYSAGTEHHGRMYIRLSGDRNPNGVAIEVAVRPNIIKINGKNNITISGLTLGMTNQPRPGTNQPEPPHWDIVDGGCQAVEITGAIKNLTISNCEFRYVSNGISPKRDLSLNPTSFNNIRITDNDFAYVDDQAITLGSNSGVRNAYILRNRLYHIGHRQTGRWYGNIPAIVVQLAVSAEIAGNIIDNCGGSAINTMAVTGGGDGPGNQIKVLVHHNKATRTMLMSCDYGGIEGWGNGPTYFFDNISGNCRGNYVGFESNSDFAPWGHAFYMDHAYRHIIFNNIAWGINNSTTSYLDRNRTGFMQAGCHDNTYYNNTIYRLFAGFTSLPGSDRSTYVGNLFNNISKLQEDNNQEGWVSVAYAKNLYSDAVPFQNLGARSTFSQFQSALSSAKARCSQLGIQSTASAMVNPAAGDFRPAGQAIGNGARVFIPWNLHGVVGLWHFMPYPADYSQLWSEDQPAGGTGNVLSCPGATAADFVVGGLEDWTTGALKFNGTSTYCKAANGTALDAGSGSLILETFVRTSAGGTIVSKTGYALDIPSGGKARLRLFSGGEYSLSSAASVNDGKWHHVVAEVDRPAGRASIWIDGALSKGAESGTMPGSGRALSAGGDFLVGKDAAGNFFGGEIDFLRVARSSFAESDTSLEELYAWEFDGPAVRDFIGKKVSGPRDAGAIQHSQGSGAP